MAQHTKDFLADELEKASLPEMAAKARRGHYHDYLSTIDFPDLQLDADLIEAGTPAAQSLRLRHHNGEFDASMEESEDWMASRAGKEALAGLVRPKTDGKQ